MSIIDHITLHRTGRYIYLLKLWGLRMENPIKKNTSSLLYSVWHNPTVDIQCSKLSFRVVHPEIAPCTLPIYSNNKWLKKRAPGRGNMHAGCRVISDTDRTQDLLTDLLSLWENNLWYLGLLERTTLKRVNVYLQIKYRKYWYIQPLSNFYSSFAVDLGYMNSTESKKVFDFSLLDCNIS